MSAKRIGCGLLALLTVFFSGCSMMSPELRDLERWMDRQPGIKKVRVSWSTVVESVGGLPDGYYLEAQAKGIDQARKAITDFRKFAADKGYSRWRFQLYWNVQGGESGVQFDFRDSTDFERPFELAQLPLPSLVERRIVDGQAPNMMIEFRSKPENYAGMVAELTSSNVGSPDAALMLTNTEFSQRIEAENFAELATWQQRITALSAAGIEFKVDQKVVKIAHQDFIAAINAMRAISGATITLQTDQNFRVETEPQLLAAVLELAPALAAVGELRATNGAPIIISVKDSAEGCWQVYQAIPATDLKFQVTCQRGSSVNALTGRQLNQIGPILQELAAAGTTVRVAEEYFKVRIEADAAALEQIFQLVRRLWTDDVARNLSIEYRDPSGAHTSVNFRSAPDGPHGEYRSDAGSDPQLVERLLAAWNATTTSR